MDRDVNCIVTKSLIDYVEETVGSSDGLLDNIHPELNGVEESRAFLYDDHNWVSCSLIKDIFQRAKELTGDENVAMRSGFDAVCKRRLGYIQEFFLKAITTPAMGLKRVQSINEKFNRTKDVEVAQQLKNGGVVKLHWFGGMEMTKDFCLLNQGIYRAITTIWGLPPLELTETECFFDGGSHCEYHVKWEPGSRRLFIKKLLAGLIPTYRNFRSALRELEKERDLLEKKYAEAHLLSLSLNEKVERLAAIQEATRVVVSMPELEDVLEEVMTLMVKVTGFERAVLMLVNEEKGLLEYGQGVGADRELLDGFSNYSVSLSRMNNVMVRVAHSGVPAFIEDVKFSNLNRDNPIIRQFSPSSFFVVPVTVRDKVIGVLAADKGSSQTVITQHERDYLIAFVNQIAGAIETGRLLESNRKSYLNSIQSLVMALEARDTQTRGHSERVTYYSTELAGLLGMSINRIELLRDIVPLHDIGKLGIPDNLLLKKSFLDRQELEVIRNHTVVGAYIVSPLNLHKDGLSIVRNHHEWFDGAGYPDGLAGEEIPDLARIVTVTDAFDAMTSRRPYRTGMSIRSALKQLKENAGIQFDPDFAETFSGAVKSKIIKLPDDIPQL